jgi:hypothetical protein
VGAPGRGHSKSLSTSSIASISSIGSAYSANEARRRPPPLVMADPHSRLSLESYRQGTEAQMYRPPSPSDFSTPTSATFSTGQSSPRWSGSGVASPISHSRSHSMYADSRTHARRLSVPSTSGNPYQSPQGMGMGRPFFGPGAMNSSNSGAFSPGGSSLLSSPTASGWTSRRDSQSSNADEAWRRRTWHPDTKEQYSAANRLAQPPTNAAPFSPSQVRLPMANQGQQPQQTLRLPGIESFDPLPQGGPVTPTAPRRAPSPMMIDSESAQRPHPMLPAAEMSTEDRRNAANVHWDMGLHRGLTRLDINNTPPRDGPGAWSSAETHPPTSASEQVNRPAYGAQQPTVRFDTEVKTLEAPTHQPPMSGIRHQHTLSAPAMHMTARETKRHGWYHGPMPTVHQTPAKEATIPEGRPHVDRIIHPNISAFQGFPARAEPHHHHQGPIVHQEAPRPAMVDRNAPSGNPDSLRRLEALVAVATSEGSTATAY